MAFKQQDDDTQRPTAQECRRFLAALVSACRDDIKRRANCMYPVQKEEVEEEVEDKRLYFIYRVLVAACETFRSDYSFYKDVVQNGFDLSGLVREGCPYYHHYRDWIDLKEKEQEILNADSKSEYRELDKEALENALLYMMALDPDGMLNLDRKPAGGLSLMCLDFLRRRVCFCAGLVPYWQSNLPEDKRREDTLMLHAMGETILKELEGKGYIEEVDCPGGRLCLWGYTKSGKTFRLMQKGRDHIASYCDDLEELAGPRARVTYINWCARERGVPVMQIEKGRDVVFFYGEVLEDVRKLRYAYEILGKSWEVMLNQIV